MFNCLGFLVSQLLQLLLHLAILVEEIEHFALNLLNEIVTVGLGSVLVDGEDLVGSGEVDLVGDGQCFLILVCFNDALRGNTRQA